MNAERSNDRYDGVFRAIVFASFLLGSLSADRLLAASIARQEWLVFSPAVMAAAFGGVLILSSSILGSALIPVFTAFFGCVSGAEAARAVSSFYSGGAPDVKALILSAFAVPLFFFAASSGMGTAAMLTQALVKSGTAAKAAFNQKYIPMTFAVAAVMLAVYFITG